MTADGWTTFLGSTTKQPRFYVLRSLLSHSLRLRTIPSKLAKEKQKCKSIVFCFHSHDRTSVTSAAAPHPPNPNDLSLGAKARATNQSSTQKSSSFLFPFSLLATTLHFIHHRTIPNPCSCLAALMWNYVQHCCIWLIESALNEMLLFFFCHSTSSPP